MGYIGKCVMDCGYFIGSPQGLVWIPPYGSNEKSEIIPWNELIEDEDENDLE